MPAKVIHYRRKLPHSHPEGYPLFITFRLADSLAFNVLLDLKKQREQKIGSASLQERVEKENKDFFLFDEWLDRCESGPIWLRNESVAQR